MTDEQKRGLEVLARVANPDPLAARKAAAHNRLAERVIADMNREGERLGLYEAQQALETEWERRAVGGLSEDVVAWYEMQTKRTDAEIVDLWRPAESTEKPAD